MTKPGPHVFDNIQAEVEEEVVHSVHSGGVLELTQGWSAYEGPLDVVTLLPRSRRALIVTYGWRGDDAWVRVRKLDAATGELLGLTHEQVSRGDETTR